MSTKWLQSLAEKETGQSLDAAPDMTLHEYWTMLGEQIPGGDDAVSQMVANAFSLPTLDMQAIELKSTRLIPESIAKRHCLCPIAASGTHLTLAIANPVDDEAIQAAGFAAGRTPDLVVASPTQIAGLIETGYEHPQGAETLKTHAESHTDSDESFSVRGKTITSQLSPSSAPTEKLFLLILKEALTLGVSDIHLQPFVGGAAVRFRIDGVMRQIKSMSIAVMSHLFRHVKAIADLDTTNARTPQDGRLTMSTGAGSRDLRLSFLPAEGGERLVIRILASGSDQGGGMNFSPHDLRLITRTMQNTSGIILATGPTGSGKTTTLYSMLRMLNHDTTNILSVEDPVEIQMRGVSQTSVNPAQGLTFPSVLRSMLRQDPDVILVGEIRDGETAELAIRAALTGHLVLSTLHTVDALSTISRLVDLGLSPTLIADALRCVLNQRLVRRLCDTCKTPVTDANRSESEHLFMSLQSDGAALYQPVGCEDCRNTGYAGRMPITQIWEITEDTRLILRNDPHNEPALREEAERRGLQSLFESARELILQGITSVDEAVRVIGNPFWQALGTEYIELKNLEDSETPVKATEKLLLVIEEDSLRARLQQQFEAMNYVVTAVKATSEAKAHIASGYPVDLMLLDVESQFATPMTQFDTLQSALAYIGVSAVLLVPEGATEVETLLEIHQATDWLSKPVTDDEVTKKVVSALHRRHL